MAAILNWIDKILTSKLNVNDSEQDLEVDIQMEDIEVIEERIPQMLNEIGNNAASVALRGAITNILTDKFGIVPANLAASLNNVTSHDALNSLVTQVYKTESLAAFEQRINEMSLTTM